MQLEVNGEVREVADRTTVAQLLSELGVTVEHVAVELNQELLPRDQHDSHHLAAGDAIEVVTLVVGVHWQVQFEWWAHERPAREAGMSDAVINAIQQGEQPNFDDTSEIDH